MIEIEAGAAERIAGRLFDEHGAAAPFDGWLGLASALERVLVLPGGLEAAAADCEEAPS